MLNLAEVVPSVAAAADCREVESEERRGLVPGAALRAAWVFVLGSNPLGAYRTTYCYLLHVFLYLWRTVYDHHPAERGDAW